MRCNPLRWLWGLIPLAMLLFVAMITERGRIEADLKQRADAELQRAGLNWATADFNGRVALLAGRAPEEGEPEKANALLRGTWGVRTVENQTRLIDKVAAYSWTAGIRDNKIKLMGYVPNDSVRKTIVGIAKANLPNRAIDDRTTTARGAPDRDTWLGGVNFALTQLANLKSGQVDLEGTQLSINGVADGFAGYKAIKAALASNLPKGIKLKVEKVSPPVVSPYTWSARHRGDRLVLGGHVPSEPQRQRLYAAAKAAFPRSAVVDRMEIADGAPKGFLPSAQATLSQLGRLDEGQADLRANVMSVAGLAATDVVANDARAALRNAMSDGIRLSEAIKFRAVAVPTASPFTTELDATGSTIVLDGYAPSEEARQALAETARARFGGRRVDNRLKVANGAPPSWQSCLQAGMAVLGKTGTGTIAASDRRMVLAGKTQDEVVHRAIQEDVRKFGGSGCQIVDRVVYEEPPEPNLTWSVQRTPERLVFDGRVPDSGTRTALLDAARRLFPGVRIDDRMSVASGPSRRWRQVAVEGVELLATLTAGVARLDGQELTVAGETDTSKVAASVRERLGARLANGYSGRDAIQVRATAPVDADAARRSREAAEGRRRAEAEAEAQRRRAEEQARLRAEEDARRRAEAEARQRAEADAERRRREAAAIAARRQAEANRCQEAIRAAAKAGTILFKRASADLDGRSDATIRTLAKAANACPTLKIEIEGHTDAEGTEERNQRLSERRAKSVLDRLTQSGVDANRLVPIGYGQSRPVAPNDTSENRARNRRIEFTVKTE